MQRSIGCKLDNEILKLPDVVVVVVVFDASTLFVAYKRHETLDCYQEPRSGKIVRIKYLCLCYCVPLQQ